MYFAPEALIDDRGRLIMRELTATHPRRYPRQGWQGVWFATEPLAQTRWHLGCGRQRNSHNCGRASSSGPTCCLAQTRNYRCPTARELMELELVIEPQDVTRVGLFAAQPGGEETVIA